MLVLVVDNLRSSITTSLSNISKFQTTLRFVPELYDNCRLKKNKNNMCLAPFEHKHVRKHGALTALLLSTTIQLVSRTLDEMRLTVLVANIW